MNITSALVVLGCFVAAITEADMVEELRLEVRALTRMVEDQQAQLTSLSAKQDFQEGWESAGSGELEMLERPPRNTPALQTADLTRRISDLETRLEETAVQAERRFEMLQREIKKSLSNVGDEVLTSGVDNLKAVDSKLRRMVSGFVNESLSQQFGVDTHDLSLFCNTKECQSGTVGTTYYHGIEKSYPKTYRIKFVPAFKKTPKFVYGMIHLDSKSIVRVNVKVTSLCEHSATVEVGSWTSKHLYGVEISWMACP